MRRLRPVPVLFLTGILATLATASPDMIARIETDIPTDFATYRPEQVAVTPRAPLFSVAPDFSDVCNFGKVGKTFSARDSALFRRNGFIVRWGEIFYTAGYSNTLYRGAPTQMYHIYNDATHYDTPIFITSDAVLHTYHVLFDLFLRRIEVERLLPRLATMIDALAVEIETEYVAAPAGPAKDALRVDLGWLWVAQSLLATWPVPPPADVAAAVAADTASIGAHAGTGSSMVLGPPSIDFTQFIPRGHYTKSAELKRYFKCMMWLGLAPFVMDERYAVAPRNTLAAILLVRALDRLEQDGAPLADRWRDIYELTSFFAGRSDDPNARDYRAIATAVWGAGYASLAPEAFAEPEKLAAALAAARALPMPKIPAYDVFTAEPYNGFRFMGQRMIPDSYMFSSLVAPFVDGRDFPKGLDVLAILGSDRAYALLDEVYGDTRLPNYPETIARFRTEFASAPPDAWAQNLYWNWLYTLQPLLSEKGPGYPQFMRNDAWRDRELIAALGSWAELRHDTILYAKQSGGITCEPPGPPKSYVEPNPHLYARLLSLVRYTREGLANGGMLLDGFAPKLDLFESLLVFLKDVAIKELENTPLTAKEYQDLYCFGDVMQELIETPQNPAKPWEGEDSDMAIVADVHTCFDTREALEVGVGYPLEIWVIVHENGETRLTRGAIFSYYEFPWPMSDRLTDEKWREMFWQGTPPAMPSWETALMDGAASRPRPTTEESRSIWPHEFDPNAITTDSRPREVTLHPNRPNPFNPETFIRFALPEAADVRLEVYDALGRHVRTLATGPYAAGDHTARWDGRDETGRDASSGIYVLRLVAGDVVRVRRMTLLR